MRFIHFGMAVLSIVLIGVLPSSSIGKPSQPRGRVGGEWTFSREELIQAGRNISELGVEQHDVVAESAVAQWLQVIRVRCPECVINDTTVHIGDSFWFKLQVDPWVVEITTEARSTDELREPKLRADINRIIWDSAREIRLRPQPRVGGGHIHLDVRSHFGSDRLLFRNFIVDLMNHPELFMGALSLDYLNAPPLAIQSEEQRQAFVELLERFDNSQMSIAEFRVALVNEVYTSTYMDHVPHPSENPWKYQAVNLSHRDTVEIRGLRPQESFDHFLAVTDLFQKRIDSLKKSKRPIPFVNKNYSNLVKARSVRGMEQYRTDLPSEKIIEVFKSYVEGAGLEWSEYSRYITTELARQIKSEGKSLLSSSPSSCSRVFSN